MLTSEYFAIDGALVLAVPTKLGQEFFYEEKNDGKSMIFWEAYHQEKLWLKTAFNYKNWEILEANLQKPSEFILQVFKKVKQLFSIKLQDNISYYIKTNLEFPSNFGWGSSSTLMNNLAEWAQINPYLLNQLSLGGSGYDIAVAKEKSAVLFTNQPQISVERINFQPSFKDELIFIHLNQKQNSREGINLYKSKEKSKPLIDEFTSLTKEIVKSDNFEQFSSLLTCHEYKIAEFLQIETAKDKYFKDCPVFIKSLGAWGGDFVMSAKFESYEAWFSEKGFSTIFSWNDIIY